MARVAKPASGGMAPTALERSIVLLRGDRVMLSHDLARLYAVEPKVLMQAVNRNLDRFPPDFMFVLTADETRILKSQIVTSSWGGARKPPHAFTEQGVAMLSSVLRSERAVAVNVEIMRAFVRLRSMLGSNRELARKIVLLEKKYDRQFKAVFEAIYQIMQGEDDRKKKRIGFVQD